MPNVCIWLFDNIKIRTVLILNIMVMIFFMVQPVGLSFAAELQKIDTLFSSNASQVVLQFDENVRYQFHNLPGTATLPNRCYVDLYSTKLAHTVPLWIGIEKANLTKIRVGVHTTSLRVVLDLNERSSCTISSSNDPFKLLLTVATTKPLEKKNENNFSRTELSEKLNLPMAPEPQSEASPLEEVDTDFADLATTEDDKIKPWGWVQFFAAQDTEKQAAEDHHLYRLRSRLGADWETELDTGDSLQLRASLDIDHIFYQQNMADDDTDVDFAETYLRLNKPSWDITLGKQRVRWGKTDQISPLDTINPQDFRQFITVDREERAIPSWLLRTRWYGESASFETIVQPWFEASEIDFFDSDWAFYRNFRKSITSNPLAGEPLKQYVRSIRVNENKPAASLKNMSAAARFSWQTEQTDFSLSYNYSWETLPTINSFPIKNMNYSGDPSDNPLEGLSPADFTNEQVQAEYKRQQTVGFEWETVIDPIGFRGEIAHKDHVAFISSDLTSERKAVTQLVSGIDYTSESEWYFNLQGSWYYIHDFTRKILYYDKNTVSLFGEIRKPIFRGNLELATKYNYIVTDGSSYLQPLVRIKYIRNLSCEIGAMFFGGAGDSLLGSYDNADQVYATLKYSF